MRSAVSCLEAETVRTGAGESQLRWQLAYAKFCLFGQCGVQNYLTEELPSFQPLKHSHQLLPIPFDVVCAVSSINGQKNGAVSVLGAGLTARVAGPLRFA